MADQKHTYAYRAINDEGVTLTGDIEAESAEQARQALLGRGLMPTEVTRRDGPLKSKRFQKFFQKPVTYKQIILFSKQFRTLFNAGVSIAAFGHPPDADGKPHAQSRHGGHRAAGKHGRYAV